MGQSYPQSGPENSMGLEKLETVFNHSNQVALLTYKKPERYSKQYHNLFQAQKLVWDDCRMEIFTL